MRKIIAAFTVMTALAGCDGGITAGLLMGIGQGLVAQSYAERGLPPPSPPYQSQRTHCYSYSNNSITCTTR